jgi:hypothetical protein
VEPVLDFRTLPVSFRGAGDVVFSTATPLHPEYRHAAGGGYACSAVVCYTPASHPLPRVPPCG